MTTKFKVGDSVYYHSFMGEPSTEAYEISVVQPEGIPSHKHPVYWLEGKAGCVAGGALSPAPSRFSRADFFGSDDEENLTWTQPEEYIDNLRANGGDYALTNDQWLNKNCPLTVHGWTRDQVKLDGKAEAERALEALEEKMMDDFGDLDGDHKLWNSDSRHTIIKEMTKVYNFAASEALVWRCTASTSREYSRDEVIAILEDWS